MLVGFPPFDGADSYSIGYTHVHEMPTSPEVVDSRVPVALAEITMKCLAKQADERYQRGYELADALIAYLADSQSPDSYRAAWLSRRLGITPTSL
jgi:serine/threonine-protein kinase